MVGGGCRKEGNEELREAKATLYVSLPEFSRPGSEVRDVRETAACTEDPPVADTC